MTWRRFPTASSPRLCGARSAPYYRVYAKLVHKGRQQKNSYLQPLVARKRWSSRRGNPMWLPGGGGRPHRAAPTQNDGPTHSFEIDTGLVACALRTERGGRKGGRAHPELFTAF